MNTLLTNINTGTKPITIPELPGIASSPSSPSSGAGSFAEAIGTAIQQVESLQKDAKGAAANLLGGGQGDVYEVALASQRADLSMELFQQVRNKFVSAYQEIMRMQM